MKRYEIITNAYGTGMDEKEDVFTLAEAKARCKNYIVNEEYSGAAIFDRKTKKVIITFNRFNILQIAPDYRADNVKQIFLTVKDYA